MHRTLIRKSPGTWSWIACLLGAMVLVPGFPKLPFVVLALGTGMSHGVGWKDFEVIQPGGRQPRLEFHGVGRERFAALIDRVRNRAALDAIVEPVFAARPMIWWMRVFERRGVPSPVSGWTYDDLAEAARRLNQGRSEQERCIPLATLANHYTWADIYFGNSDYPGDYGLLYHQDSAGHFVAVPIEQGIDHPPDDLVLRVARAHGRRLYPRSPEQAAGYDLGRTAGLSHRTTATRAGARHLPALGG
jgi:hypothetical protein